MTALKTKKMNAMKKSDCKILIIEISEYYWLLRTDIHRKNKVLFLFW